MDAVVVTHNSASDLRHLLTCAPLRDAFARVVVVDNGSTDDTVAVARATGGEVVERANDSLSAAINVGVARCRTELVGILNPDVLLDDAGDVALLAAAFDEDRSLGVCAPSLRLPGGSVQDSAREVPSPVDLLRRRLRGREDGALRPHVASDVPWVVGAFLVVRRSAFDSVGGFDERFKLYFEDVDFCLRIWSAGWRVRLMPDAVVRHEHQASSRASLVGWAARQHARSAMRFYATHPDQLTGAGRRRLVRARRGGGQLDSASER